ncbi:mobA/MobL family protein [Rickettsia hoogstraalii str. RCCE3]|nr:mobA/MobL family protein [Rickettsia hoogstraalii str. RCCE3]
MNEVERIEKRKNSQLLKDIVIALPDDKELDLQDRITITHEIIEEMAWVKNGLGVQVDIHKPHDGEKIGMPICLLLLEDLQRMVNL